VVVVGAIQGVEVEPPDLFDVALVSDDGALVVLDHALIVTQQHVDVRRHVHQMARVGDQPTERVRGVERLFWRRRHLHQMDVEVQQARVGDAPWTIERRVQHLLGFERASAFSGRAGRQVPQRPGRKVHQ
jgi:hypothetical protein